MNKEPVGVITAIRFVLNSFVQGLVLWDVVSLTTEQHAWLTFTAAGVIESIMWLITRNEVWAPNGAPTHPATEKLWSEKLAAETAELKAMIEESVTGRHTATSQAAEVAMVDNINPGADE